MKKIFQFTFLAFIVVMALVVGGACYQTVSVTPYWKQDLTMFKNYSWGINYFPILSPLMTVLWLGIFIMGFKQSFPKKWIFYIGHFFFLLITICTFVFFAPFLLKYMGHPENWLAGQDITAQVNTWATWDIVRQMVGMIPLAIFIYCYGQIKLPVHTKLAVIKTEEEESNRR